MLPEAETLRPSRLALEASGNNILVALTRRHQENSAAPPGNQQFNFTNRRAHPTTIHRHLLTLGDPTTTANMATELTVQSERSFQKQPHIFLNSKVKTKVTKPGKGGRRWYKDVGRGFRTPKAAIDGTYIGM